MSATEDNAVYNPFMSDVDVMSLKFGAGFLLWGFRVCATGHVGCPRVRQGFACAFGEGEKALELMETFTGALAELGRRRVYCAIPACGNLTHDEMCLIQTFQAAQAEERERVEMQLTWLLGRSAPATLCRCVEQLAALFQCQGYSIAMRDSAQELPSQAPVPPETGVVPLH